MKYFIYILILVVVSFAFVFAFDRDTKYDGVTRIDENTTGVHRQFFPKKHRNLYMTAVKYLNGGDYNNAVATYNEIISLSPDEYLALHGLGSSLYYLGDFIGARNAYEDSIAANEEFSSSYLGLASIESRNQNYPKAIQLLNTSISKDRKNSGAYYSRALAYTEIGEFQKALQDYKKVIRLVPESELAKKAKSHISLLKTKI